MLVGQIKVISMYSSSTDIDIDLLRSN